MTARIRKGDMVAVVSGDERGKRGRVLEVIQEKNRVVIEGVNLVFKHLRKSQKHPNGGRIRREAAVHLSNVMPIDPETNKPTRVRFESKDGKRVRVARRSGASLEVEVTRRADKKSGGKKAAAGKED